MATIIEQILTIITTPPGNLVYHMVLAFSIAGALVSSINHYRGGEDAQGRRMVIGFSLILAARLGLFLIAGLGWQALNLSTAMLPNLDRAVNTFCLVLIVWLWDFPEPLRLADAATVLLALIVIVLFGFTSLWWVNQSEGAYFSGSLVDIIWQSFSLLLIIAGIVLLLYRQPRSWEIGLGMLILLFIGYFLELLFPLGDSDYPGFVRLAQMTAYPILLLLPQRSQIPALGSRVSQQPAQQRRLYSIDPKIMHSFMALATESSPSETCQEICRAISQSILADLCILITPPDGTGSMSILCGYDLIRENPVEGVDIDSDNVPRLAAAMRENKPLRLLTSTTSIDLDGIRIALGLPVTGSLLAAPINIPGRDAPLSSVLISLYSRRDWTDDDQSYLQEINTFITQTLQHPRQLADLEAQLEDSSRELESLQSIQNTRHNQTAQELGQVENVAALIVTHQEAQATIERLETEIEALRQTADSVSSDGSITPQELDIIQSELRLTLEEVAHLRTALAEADQKIHTLEKTLTLSIGSDKQDELAASLVQELRQPLSSILGYTELLHGESVGILGALQRKFLDRIKASTERMSTLVEDLAMLEPADESAYEVTSKPIELSAVVTEAITYTDTLMNEKNITLDLEVPEQLPRLYADRDAIQQVLIHLLQNAIAASPKGSEISLRAQIEEGDKSLDYVLLQVSDRGEGIPSEDLPRVFSSLYRADSTSIQGIGNTGVELAIVKTLVEAHSGRIWVDTKQDIGSTFSILLPVSTAAASSSAEERGENTDEH